MKLNPETTFGYTDVGLWTLDLGPCIVDVGRLLNNSDLIERFRHRFKAFLLVRLVCK